MYRSLCKLLATVFYTGFFPIAPGTVGTLIAFFVYLLLPKQIIELPCFWLFPLLLTIPSVVITSEAEKGMDKDDKRIVLDEFIGFFYATLFLPKSIILAVAAFFLFRLFDITKPPPINRIQSWRNGWGIVFDDIAAGIFANLILQIGYFILVG